MAKNITYKPGDVLSLVVTDPATPASGDPVLIGQMSGVALAAEGASKAGETSVDLGPFVATFSVKGVDGGGNSAVAIGDAIYYVTADTPKLSKKATGVLFGYALGTITSGSTATIPVKHAAV